MAKKAVVASLVVFVLLVVGSACANPANERIAELEAQVEQLQGENEQLEERNTELEEQTAELEQQLAAILEPRQADPVAWQPHMALLQLQDTPFPSQPGTTDWEALTEHPFLGHTGASPGEVLAEFAEATATREDFGVEVPGELILRLKRQNDTATGVILQWGLLDDSLPGVDNRFQLRRAGAEWVSDKLEARYHCRRGVAQNRCK